MGLTHYSILNQIIPEAEFTFVETNSKLSFLLKNNINVKFISEPSLIKSPQDFTLVTTPPFVHKSILIDSIKREDKNIFVEKPFGGHRNNNFDTNYDNIFIGYVLRFNPIVSWIKNNIKKNEVREVNASYRSNTIEQKPTGWRNGNYSGVLNEMGSHIIDLSNYLFGLKNFKVEKSEIKSVFSDVDDIVYSKIITDYKIFNFNLNWVDSSIRKPVFDFEVILKKNKKIVFDQQKIEIFKSNKLIEKKYTVDLIQQIPYYLRGVDFTSQMLDLINHKSNLCRVEDALLVNNVMNKILEK